MTWWVRRWRVWIASFAVVATLTAVGVAGLQQWIAWRTQDALVERTLSRYATYVAQTFADGVARNLADIPLHSLGPVLGAGSFARDDRTPVSLAALEAHLRTTPRWRSLARDSVLTLAIEDRRPGHEHTLRLRPIGAAADTAEVRRLLVWRRRADTSYIGLNTPTSTFTGTPRRYYYLIGAWQKDAAGRPVAHVQLLADGPSRIIEASRVIYRFVSMEPPIVAPGDAAESAATRRRDGGDPRAPSFNARFVAVWIHSDSTDVYRSPNWSEPWVARSPLRATDRTRFAWFDVDVVLRPDVRMLFPEAHASRGAQVMLAGVLALAAMLALAAVAGLRRQHELTHTRELFVSSISHELRTPLTQIRLFSESLLNERARSPEQARRWVRVIDREARRLGDLVENALLFARSHREPVRLATQPVSLASVMDAVVEAMQPLADAASASLAVSIAPTAHVLGDERALRHVLQNLVDNALKYGPPGQTVRVAAVQRTPDTLDVTVDDAGPGIPAADRERVWQPFVRLDGSDGGGTGLGLHVVHTLVRGAGGDVWIDDAPSGGTRIVVRLPIAA